MPSKPPFSEPPDVNIIATYGGVTLAPAPPAHKPKRAILWDLIPKLFTTVRSIVLNLLFVGFLATVGILTYQALTRSPTTIEAFSVPPELDKQGLTGTVIAHKLWDQIAHIQEASGTSKQQVALLPEARQFDIVEPDSGISFLSLTNMLRALLNRPQKVIGGEITCKSSKCSGDSLHLTIRLLDHGREVVIDAPLDLSKPEPPLQTQALAVLKTLDPYSVAAYYKNVDGKTDRAREIALEIYASRSPQADWAANLLGNIASAETPLAAIEWYKKSIEIDPNFDFPWVGWGNALATMKLHNEAVKKFERATQIDKEYAAAWINIGISLSALERHDEAFKKYKRASEIEPENSSVWYNWGVSLDRAGRYGEAVENYKKATEIDPKHREAWANWGYRLSRLGQYKESFEKYQTSLQISPDFSAAAALWHIDLSRALNQPDTDRCSTATAQIPKFLDHAADLVDAAKVSEFETILAECADSEG